MLIDGLNLACKNIFASSLKIGDESMSAIRFWTTTKGNLHHLYYIFLNMEPLGEEFKKVSCPFTVDLLFFEVRRGK